MTEIEAFENIESFVHTYMDCCSQKKEDELYESLSVIKKAVEKQIPKKTFAKWTEDDYRCPVCHCEVILGHIKLGYCRACGQEIDWFSVWKDENNDN